MQGVPESPSGSATEKTSTEPLVKMAFLHGWLIIPEQQRLAQQIKRDRDGAIVSRAHKGNTPKPATSHRISG
jgi:hypothetical protein